MLIKNNGNKIRHVGGVMLIPGTNNVSEKDWEKFKNDSLYCKLIENEEIEPVIEKKGNKEADDITSLSAEKAKELVGDTFDTALLNAWKEKESRKTVIEAIEKQIKVLYEGEEEGEETIE